MTPEERAQLERVGDLVRAVLGDEALGAYLFGSATLDGLRPESDLDVLALAARRLTPAEKRALGDGMLALTQRPRRLELTVAALPELRPWRFPPRMELQYGDWLREEFARGEVEPEREENPDLAILLAMTRERGEPVFGPPAAELLDPVPADDLERAMTSAIDDVFNDLDGDTRNMLLTLARIWCTTSTGEIRSKDAAAAWALERLPEEHRDVLALARAAYLGEATDDWDALRDRVRPHAEHVVERIRASSDFVADSN